MKLQIKTPDFSHLTSEDYDYIYEPSEDTFLLIDALQQDLDQILNLRPSVCLEVGSGSGIVITALGTVIGSSCKYIATDINPVACTATAKTGSLNGVDVKTLCTNLVAKLPEDYNGKVDIILFNPPYVPTPSSEIAAGLLELTWAGGERGREVMDRFFSHVSTLLSPKGIFYLLVEKQNNIEEVKQILYNYGFNHHVLLNRRAGREDLTILKFVRR